MVIVNFVNYRMALQAMPFLYLPKNIPHTNDFWSFTCSHDHYCLLSNLSSFQSSECETEAPRQCACRISPNHLFSKGKSESVGKST